jgi:ABC-type sugar transport system ATPase subunit
LTSCAWLGSLTFLKRFNFAAGAAALCSVQALVGENGDGKPTLVASAALEEIM